MVQNSKEYSDGCLSRGLVRARGGKCEETGRLVVVVPAEVAFLIHRDEKLVKLVKHVHLAQHSAGHVHLPCESIGVERHRTRGSNFHLASRAVLVNASGCDLAKKRRNAAVVGEERKAQDDAQSTPLWQLLVASVEEREMNVNDGCKDENVAEETIVTHKKHTVRDTRRGGRSAQHYIHQSNREGMFTNTRQC